MIHEEIIVELFKDGCCDKRTLIKAKRRNRFVKQCNVMVVDERGVSCFGG